MSILTKEARLALIRQRYAAMIEASELMAGDLPVSKHDVDEAVGELDAFREHTRDVRTNRNTLTSDEG